MKLHLQGGTKRENLIRGYGDGEVVINDTRYTRSLILMPQRIIEDWPPSSYEALEAEHLAQLAQLQAEVVLLGTGPTLRFPPVAHTRALIQAHIGFEVMDTAAACRTYNILMGEGRIVAAALIIQAGS